jgi:hypothetical protein
MKWFLVVACLVGLQASASADPAADAQVTLDAWVAAQNDGDFAAYGALYARTFVGIRRTSDGRAKKMKWKAWKADRKKMFKKKMTVAADKPTFEVLDGRVQVSFLQRWKSGSYADHGTKHLVLAPDKAGVLHIVKEELLSSTPGC